MSVYNPNNHIPPEIIYQILTYQFRDFMLNDYPTSPEKFNENLRIFLRSNSTVNKTFYHICRVLVYHYCNFTTAKRFNDLLRTLKQNKQLCNAVEVADFQELTSIGLGRTAEMNKMIKNLTNETLFEYLVLTKNSLREFLACEHIQNDLDVNIIYFLLRSGTVLSVLDFCGCSGVQFTENFIEALNRLYLPNNPSQPIRQNFQITCLGLNDCTDLPPEIIGKTLKLFPELQKLDLSHTSIEDETLNTLPNFKNLTHLNLAMCLQLTPRGVLEFFAHHPSVTDENNSTTLQWLSVRVSKHSSSWTEVHTMFLLKKLCKFKHNKTLGYLNIGGLPLHEDPNFEITKHQFYYQILDTLQFIKWNFVPLKSLSIRENDVSIPRLVDLISPVVYDLDDNQIQSSQQLKFLNISDNSYINKWTILDTNIYTASSSLCAIEVSFDSWRTVEHLNDRHELIVHKYKNPNSIIKDIADAEIIKWKCYFDSSYGRRYWLYKIDEYINRGDLDTVSNITKFDSEGHKIIEIVKQPDFLKYAQTKLMLGLGLVPQTSYRRKRCYRDFKPQISNFFTRKGSATVGRQDLPIITPRLPPGGWRLMNNDNDSDSETESVNEQTQATTNREVAEGIQGGEITNDSVGPGTQEFSDQHELSQNGLYWDRSIQNLGAMAQSIENRNNVAIEPVEQTDEEYLIGHDMERRRSQFNLLKNKFSHPSINTYETSGLKSISTSKIRKRKYYIENPDEFIYDTPDSEMTRRYRIHFDIMREYAIFGTVERGMYRYYSLKT